jgi:mannose-6-phosphate isomerase-like protein (cupin superfamily)
MGDVMERGTPSMHTSDTIDYDVVVRGEMTLELDDEQRVYLKQGDCIVENGTRSSLAQSAAGALPDGIYFD